MVVVGVFGGPLCQCRAAEWGKMCGPKIRELPWAQQSMERCCGEGRAGLAVEFFDRKESKGFEI